MGTSGQHRAEDKISGIKDFNELEGQNSEKIVFSGYLNPINYDESYIEECDDEAGAEIFGNEGAS